MALVDCDFYSESLEMGASVTVVLPQATETQIGVDAAAGPAGDLPVLYLLHGLSDDHSACTRYTSIERYAAAAGLAVVMPAVGRSFYADERHGHRYWTYLSEELPRVMGSFFRFSDRREDTFVAGLSMGGYGAVRLALTHPDRFAAVASLSGALDVLALAGLPERQDLFDRVYGGRPGADEDLFALLADATVDDLPPMYVSCGTEDPLLPLSQRFAKEAVAAGAAVTTDFRPGEHEWGLWDDVIQDVIHWLPRG
jgi:S-formylglutathione hydrolase FrmB